MFNQPLNFDTADVTSMADMFHVSSALSDLKRWTRHLPSHQGHQSPHVFPACIRPLLLTWQGAAAFNQLLRFDTSSVTDMSGMFQVRSVPCPQSLLLGPFLRHLLRDPRLVFSARRLFACFFGQQARAFNQPLFFNTSSVTDTGWMFAVRCASLAPTSSLRCLQPTPLLSALIYGVLCHHLPF